MAKPICFMIMPFNTKKADAASGLPPEIDFDLLWRSAFSPAIESLGYHPMRADQDIGALIIAEMMEKLALSDLVLADITIPNGNVYYEVGVRHAAVKAGCVLLAAEKAKPLFDIDQMRQIRYPLPEGKVTPETAGEIARILREGIPKLRDGISPVFQALPGFPDKVSPERANAFKELMDGLTLFRAEANAVAEAAGEDRPARALALRDKYAGKPAMVPFVALEILHILRDHLEEDANWRAVVEYIAKLPQSLQDLAAVREQKYLAQAKLGDAEGSIGHYKELIRVLGDSSDRQGQIGGRYKQLYKAAKAAGEAGRAARHLNKAIEHYDRGMRLDLNAYYPSSNLSRLLRTRDRGDDAERARQVAMIAMHACLRAKELDSQDGWVRPTLLGMAFDAADIAVARRLVGEIELEGDIAAWKLETTLADLETSLALLPDGEPFKAAAAPLVERLRLLVRP